MRKCHAIHMLHPPLTPTANYSTAALILSFKSQKKRHKNTDFFVLLLRVSTGEPLASPSARSRCFPSSLSLIARQAIDLIHIVMFVRGNFKTARPHNNAGAAMKQRFRTSKCRVQNVLQAE